MAVNIYRHRDNLQLYI